VHDVSCVLLPYACRVDLTSASFINQLSTLRFVRVRTLTHPEEHMRPHTHAHTHMHMRAHIYTHTHARTNASMHLQVHTGVLVNTHSLPSCNIYACSEWLCRLWTAPRDCCVAQQAPHHAMLLPLWGGDRPCMSEKRPQREVCLHPQTLACMHLTCAQAI